MPFIWARSYQDEDAVHVRDYLIYMMRNVRNDSYTLRDKKNLHYWR